MLIEMRDEENNANSSGPGDRGNASGNNKQTGMAQKKRIVMVVIIVLVLLLVIGCIVQYMINEHISVDNHAFTSTEEQGAEKNWNEVGVYGAVAKSYARTFIDMEPFIINLNIGNTSNTVSKSTSLLRLKIKLEIVDIKDRQSIEDNMPKIRDVFQVYLRELRPSDLQGSVGLYRLREELLLRANKLVYPAQVADILFDEVLIQ